MTKQPNFTPKEDLKKVVVNQTHGIKRILYNLEDSILKTQMNKFKSHFGIDMVFITQSEINAMTDWIKDHDPNFKNHISNPHELNNINTLRNLRLSGTFILKVAKATYMYVDSTHICSDTYVLHVYIFGKKSHIVYDSVSKFIYRKKTQTNKIYSITGEGQGSESYWTCTSSTMPSRSIGTVFIDNDKKKRIMNHIDKWKRNKQTYVDRGLLYKTGILLYGHAGTGKSTMAIAIANYLECSLISIDPATFHNINLSEVTLAINTDETTYVVLIDEIDTIFASRDDETASDLQKEKTSKLLAFLDSPQSPSRVIFIATTNYYDRLDSALTRPGRFDIIEEFGDISKDNAIEMCKSFCLSESDIEKVLSFYEDKEYINPSNLQDTILKLVKDNLSESSISK